MSPTSYRTAPPRVTDRNTHRNTTPDRRSSASGAPLQATPHDEVVNSRVKRFATRRSLRIGTASSVSNANALPATMLEAAHRHLVQNPLSRIVHGPSLLNVNRQRTSAASGNSRCENGTVE